MIRLDVAVRADAARPGSTPSHHRPDRPGRGLAVQILDTRRARRVAGRRAVAYRSLETLSGFNATAPTASSRAISHHP